MAKRFTRKYKKGDSVEVISDTLSYNSYGYARTKGLVGNVVRYYGDSMYVVEFDKAIPGFTERDSKRAYVNTQKLKFAHTLQVELL